MIEFWIMPNSVHVHVHVHPNLGHNFPMPFHDANPLENHRALEDFFLQAQMSTLERIECYLGAFESGTRSFWVDKKGVRCCFAPMGILGGFGAGGCVFFQTWGHTERNWKQGASQEITQ